MHTESIPGGCMSGKFFFFLYIKYNVNCFNPF